MLYDHHAGVNRPPPGSLTPAPTTNDNRNDCNAHVPTRTDDEKGDHMDLTTALLLYILMFALVAYYDITVNKNTPRGGG